MLLGSKQREIRNIERLGKVNIITLPPDRPFLRILADLVVLTRYLSSSGDVVVIVADLEEIEGCILTTLLFLTPVLVVYRLVPEMLVYIRIGRELIRIEHRDLMLIGRALLMRNRNVLTKIVREYDNVHLLSELGLVTMREDGTIEYRDVYYLVYVLAELALEAKVS